MKRPYAWLALLLVVTFGLYAPSFANGFTFDDADVARVPTPSGSSNPYIADLQPLSVYFTTSYTASHDGYGRGFRPISVISFALVHHFSERARPARGQPPPPGQPLAPAAPQHVVNVLLHCLAVWLMFELLVLFFGKGPGALCGATVFALHAIRTEGVIPIVGRSEVMGFAFGAAGLLLYVQALRTRGAARVWRLGVVALLTFLACGSKENAIPWIVMTPLFVVALRLRGGNAAEGLPSLRGQVVPWLVGCAIPAAVFLVLLFRLWGSLTEVFEPQYDTNPLWYATVAERIATATIVLAYGLYKTFLPIHLNVHYGHGVFEIVGLGDPRFLASAALLLACLAGGAMSARKHPALLIAVAFFFGFTFLISNVPLPIETIFGERHYYIPAVGLSFFVSWLAARKAVRRSKNLWLGFLAIWSLGCGVLILQRNAAWQDNESLFAADAATQPRSIFLQMTQVPKLRSGDPRILLEKLMAAHRVDPQAPDPLLELADFYERVGDFDRAEKFAMACANSPHVDVRNKRAGIQSALGRVKLGKKDLAAAERHFREAVRIAESTEKYFDPNKRMELADFYRRTGRPDDAKRELGILTRKMPNFPHAWELLLGMAQDANDLGAVERLLGQVQVHIPTEARFGAHGAILAFKRKDLQRAGQLFQATMRHIPQDPNTARYWLGFAEFMAGAGGANDARGIVARFRAMPLEPPLKEQCERLAAALGLCP